MKPDQLFPLFLQTDSQAVEELTAPSETWGFSERLRNLKKGDEVTGEGL